MTTVAIDIDDTLYSFGQLARETFVEVALERGDKRLQRAAYCAWGEWRSPSDVVDNDYWMEVIDRCHQPEVIREQVPFSGAVETLQELVHQGYHLIYISNRSPEVADATYDWLYDNGFPTGSVVDLICTTEDKARHVGQCQYIIDDRPKTLVEFVYDFTWKFSHGSENLKKQRKGFGLFGDYNRALTDIPNVYLAPNWKLLRQYMIDKGVLSGSPRSASVS